MARKGLGIGVGGGATDGTDFTDGLGEGATDGTDFTDKFGELGLEGETRMGWRDFSVNA